MTLSVTILVSAFVSLTLTPMMCARLLRHKPEASRAGSIARRSAVFEASSRLMGGRCAWVLRHQTVTLLVTVGTLAARSTLYIYRPEGFFPVQDTGVILGVSEAAQNISFRAMADRQQALAEVILQDPAVESLSSFIGIDGTNTTLNSGRMQINLKPLDERTARRHRDHSAAAAEAGKSRGITLYMQPVQDLTVEDRVSRTQYQYSLEDADAKELNAWAPKLVDKLQTLPELRDVASDQQNRACRPTLVIDRDTASGSASRRR